MRECRVASDGGREPAATPRWRFAPAPRVDDAMRPAV